jgi:hypothetical protein
MTHSGGKPHAVGDRGQRYEIRCTGYPKDIESVIGWGEKADGAMRMAMGILKAPGARTAKIVDRQEKTETEVTR